MKTIRLAVFAAMLVVGLMNTGCVTGMHHARSQHDYIAPDGTVHQIDNDWTTSSPLNLPMRYAELPLKMFGEVWGVGCDVGKAIILPPPGYVPRGPDYYVWDGCENIGWYNGQMMYSYDRITWNPAPPVVIGNWYSYSNRNPGWFNERHVNDNRGGQQNQGHSLGGNSGNSGGGQHQGGGQGGGSRGGQGGQNQGGGSHGGGGGGNHGGSGGHGGGGGHH